MSSDRMPRPIEQLVGSGSVELGAGVVLEPGVLVSGSTSDPGGPLVIGAGTTVAGGTVLGLGAHVGPGCTLGSGVFVDGRTRVGADTVIDSGCVIGPEVQIGGGNRLLWHTLILRATTIGDANEIGPSAVIGAEPQHPGRLTSKGHVRIGSRNILREFVTVHLPIHDLTAIGDGCYLMAYAHVPHDAIIDDAVTVANAVQIGGHCRVMHHANLGLASVVHQNVTIGPGAMIGMGSIVGKDVPPFVVLASRGGVTGLNEVGLQRLGRSGDDIAALGRWYAEHRDSSAWSADLAPEQSLWCAEELRTFVSASRRAVYEMRLRPPPESTD